jgi:hypothetical protein
MRKSRASFEATVMLMLTKDIDICFIQEPPAHPGPYTSEYIYIRTDASSRVAVLIRRNLETTLLEELDGQSIKRDVLCCQIKIGKGVIWIVSAYCDITEEMRDTSDNIRQIIKSGRRRKARVIVTLDSNSWSPRWGSVKRKQNEYNLQWKRGEVLEDLMDTEGLLLGRVIPNPANDNWI